MIGQGQAALDAILLSSGVLRHAGTSPWPLTDAAVLFLIYPHSGRRLPDWRGPRSCESPDRKSSGGTTWYLPLSTGDSLLLQDYKDGTDPY